MGRGPKIGLWLGFTKESKKGNLPSTKTFSHLVSFQQSPLPLNVLLTESFFLGGSQAGQRSHLFMIPKRKWKMHPSEGIFIQQNY